MKELILKEPTFFKTIKIREKMTPSEQFEIEILKDVKKWSNEEIYSFFGARIEDAFLQEKKKLQALLKKAWENRFKYS
jgi:hypothetical protein